MAHPPYDLEVITPEGPAFHGPITSARLPGKDGSFGILARHARLLAALDAGLLIIEHPGGKREAFAVGEGFVEVGKKGVRALVDFCDAKSDIDVARAKQAEERAKERLRSRAADIDMLRAEASLRRAVARLTVAHFEELA